MVLGLSFLDWGILLIVVLSVLEAAAQGFFYELFAFSGVIVGYLVAAWEYPRLAGWYMRYVNSQWVADMAGFLTIFAAIALLSGVIGRIARLAVSGVGLRWFDRVLGALFGVLRGAVVATIIVMALAAFSPTSGYLQNSRVAPFMLVTGRGLIWAAPADLRARFRAGWELLRTLPEHVQHPSR